MRPPDTSQGSEVALVIPTADPERLLPLCLAALAEQRGVAFSVVVVDNSPGGAAARVAVPDGLAVRTLAPGENRGFAAAVNDGVRATDTPFVAVLNDDAFPEPDWLSTLVRVLAEDTQLAAVAGTIVSDSDSTRLDNAGDGVSRWLLPYPVGRFERECGQYPTRDVLTVSWCAAVIRRAAFDALSGLEPSFFAYFEDVDFGLRAHLLGYRARFVAEARCRHVGSATTGGMINATTVRLSTRNLVRTQARTLPAGIVWRRLHRLLAGHLYWFAKMAIKERHPIAWLRGFVSGAARVVADRRAHREWIARRAVDDDVLLAALDRSAIEVTESIRRKRAGG